MRPRALGADDSPLGPLPLTRTGRILFAALASHVG
jgi:hypothetical protein